MPDATTRLAEALADRYRIEREIGAGGMATVYLAEDLRHHRKVAIKLLRTELGALLGAERFLAEIQTTANLQHPNILPLFDSGAVPVDPAHPERSEGSPLLFYVMPFIDGETLRQRITREKCLPVEDALRLTREIADALACAHAHDVIHRDIKPENILLQSGHAVVADFGIARAVKAAGSERMTATGLAIGTPAYMSPEQAAGERDVDGRSDLYALASVLYEMLAGEAPFTGATRDVILLQRFTQPPPKITTKRPGIPRAIEAAICTAMARAPEDRFPTVERFVASLEAKTGAPDADLDRSIAVLPFANMSGDPENEYFSDGVSEEIINALAQLPRLRVAARTSAFSFKGKHVDLRSIGDQLNVATVLEGSVRKVGGRIRITAQLSNVADGYQLWSERYDRELTDIFAIQDEIATAIAEKLMVTLGVTGEGQLVRPPTGNMEAYDLYLKGHALMKQRGPALLGAVEVLEQAVALDPQLAPAQAELAEALILASVYGVVAPADIRHRATAATARAQQLGPDSVGAQIALALHSLMVEFDRAKASAAFVRAVTLDPLDVDARMLRASFDLCYVRGEFDAAQAELRALIDSDPLNGIVRGQLAFALAFGGKSEEAAIEARHGIEIDSGAFYLQWSLLHALVLGPKPAKGVEAGRPMLARFGRDPRLLMGMAYGAGAAGQREQAEAIHDELLARARAEYVQPVALAVAAVGAHRKVIACEHIRAAARGRDPLLVTFGLHWPGFASIRNEAAYAAALALIGW